MSRYLGFLILLSTNLPAQSLTGHLSARAIPVFTTIDHGPGGESFSEFKLVQPIVMLQVGALGDRLLLHLTADFEGQTMPGGELAIGDWGEGFVDRRHPHTYLHEAMLTGVDLFGGLDGRARLSVSAGKGFAPFGTDDPMSRPTLRYPVNHHFSQILERALAMAAVDVGPVTLEGGLFNGDEPERPGQWPRVGHRFGDSWSARFTLRPLEGMELQGSRAKVHSPEHRGGAGTDNHKWSASVRLDRRAGRVGVYGLAEWARTDEAGGFFVFHSWLIEGSGTLGHHQAYGRYERTERPEEIRTVDPFRSQRPHLDNSILGITRWSIFTLGYGFDLAPRGSALQLEPFVEASHARPISVGGGIFRPEVFYGSSTIWSVSIGARLGFHMQGHRMGRYVPSRSGMEGMGHH